MAESFPKPFGKYQLLRKLAQGGMAEIFLAQDERGRIVAIKRILPHLAHEESFIRMFIDEARIVSHLDHPNIAAVYDQGKEQGYYYIVMEFVQGHSLLALSERAKATKMELPRGLLAFVVAELLAGLGCAHSARDAKGRHLAIVHRDVTPQNVLISYDGEVKLVDFGVAKARARLTQTEAGFTKGKLAYMSPEQARGEELDGRSDLFSVGIILHEITTNSRLFNKEGPGGILGAIVNDPIPPPSTKVRGFPKALETVVMRGLEKEVSQRYQTAEDMRDDLLRVARRERPPPTRQRLSALVHDLFGEPDSQAVIDRALELAAPTPDKVEAHSAPEVPIPRSRSALPSSEPEPKRSDETRMMAAEAAQSQVRARSKVEITNPSAIAVSVGGTNASQRAESPVPEPQTPWRVRLGSFLEALAIDVRLSWREHRRRWLLGLFAAGVGLLLLVFAASGLPREVWSWASMAAEEVKPTESEPAAPLPRDAATVLTVSSEPPGASIIVNGVGMGAVTPHAFDDLPLGRPLRIELSLAGYRTLEEQVTLRAGQGAREEHFRLERRYGALRVTSDPAGARVRLNGRAVEGKTPVELTELPAGATARVEVRAAGRLSQSRVALVPDEGLRTLHFVLPMDRRQIPPGRIVVKSQPSGCPVEIDEAYVGVTPVEKSAKAGLHSVKVSCEFHAPEYRSVTVIAKSTASVDVAARPDTFGFLTIETIPVRGTKVEINGRAVTTPVRFRKVVPGRHVVTIKNGDLGAEKQITVQVGPNARITRRVSLTF